MRAESGSGGGEQGQGTPSVVSEELLSRLRQAEAEAQRLKRELAAAQADRAQAPVEAGTVDRKQLGRIDGGDLQRETLFSGGGESAGRGWTHACVAWLLM
jgi:hypothetical protein